MNRQVATEALCTVLKNTNNAVLLEKYVYQQTKDVEEAIYIWCIYQVVGLLLQGTQPKQIATDVRAGRIGWCSPPYDTVAAKITEFDEYLVKPFEIAEGVVQCGKCQSWKTWSVQRQTRSQDEPMTTFSRCVVCGSQWSYSG